MKYIVVIGNGLTDQPVAEKDNKTPLQLAETPNLDRLVHDGRTGSVRTIPESMHPGNDVSFLSLLGYDPEKYYAGPAHFVAIGLDVSLESGEVPLCCDFVVLQSGHNDMVMKDYTAGQLSDNDSKNLLQTLQDQIIDVSFRFHLGIGYHNLMTIKMNRIPERLNPPDELIGEGIRDYMPSGKATKDLVFVMNQAQIILHNHDFNKKRRSEGQDMVNSIWFWGNGNPPALPSFTGKYTFNSAVVTASPLLKGMAKHAGMQVIPVEGTTGFIDTNYSGKVEAAFRALEEQDLVYLQVTAPERASMQGQLDDKVLALEDFDEHVVGPILERMNERNDVKMLLCVNQMCSANLMKYTKDPVPFVVYPARQGADAHEQFDEEILKSTELRFNSGVDLVSAWFKGNL